MRTLSRFLALLVGGVLASQAATLQVIMSAGPVRGPRGQILPHMEVNETRYSAMAGDTLLAMESVSGTGTGLGQHAIVSERYARGRAAIANLGAEIGFSLSGDYTGENPTMNGSYVLSSYVDLLSYDAPVDAAFLQADVLVEGSGTITNYGNWVISSSTIFGSRQLDTEVYTFYTCADWD